MERSETKMCATIKQLINITNRGKHAKEINSVVSRGQRGTVFFVQYHSMIHDTLNEILKL